MSGHRPFSELVRDFSPERRRRNALASQRLGIKIQLAQVIGEKLLRQNDELSDLLCDPELDATDRELVAAIERLVVAVAESGDDFTSNQRYRLAELTRDVRGWIAQAESEALGAEILAANPKLADPGYAQAQSGKIFDAWSRNDWALAEILINGGTGMKYDYIVVGGGSAGCTIATRLSEDPQRSVLLLEAGPDYPQFETLPEDVKLGNNVWLSAYGPHSWAYRGHMTDEMPDLEIPRGKVTGGSSAINGQVLFRGIPEDYDRWAEWGNNEWGFTSCLPYFNKLETDLDFGGSDFHGSDGPVPVRRSPRSEWLPHALAFEQAAVAAGYPIDEDMNHPESTGCSPRARNTLNFKGSAGVRMSMSLNYLDMARHRLNFTIRGGVTARRIVFDGDRAVGVEAESGGEIFVVEGAEIILCGGAVASPQLLMLSGVGPAEHLQSFGINVVHDAPGVGQNLRDHPSAAAIFRATGDRPDVQAPVIQVGLRYTIEGSPLRNDMQLSPMLMTSEHRPAQVDIDDDLNYIGMSASLQLALGQGELTLQSADPHIQPFLNYNYYREEEDLRRMREAIRLGVRMAAHPSYAGLVLDRVTPTDEELADDGALDDWLRRNSGTSHHISGTCKMGPDSDPLAVVDQHLRVKGVQNLRVADASIMPDCIRANTNATTIMIGERCADFIKEGK